MSSTTFSIVRTNPINIPTIRVFFCFLLISSVLFSGNAVHAAGELEPVLKDRGKHYQTESEVIPVPEDGIHDPSNDAVHVFQAPYEAMVDFPRDAVGNVNWVETVKRGLIEPRADMLGETQKKTLDMDIIFTDTGKMPHVRFPHLSHTLWLDCSNCHPAIFTQKKGANDIAMTDIFQGKFCGLCHGKVAFPPTKNCMRCHSVPQNATKK